MQIHEITQSQDILLEAPPRPVPPQAAALKQRRQGMAQGPTTVAQAQQQTGAAGVAPAAAPAAAPGFQRGLLQKAQDAVAGFQQSRQQRNVQQNTQAVAKAALQQWRTKVMQLVQASGGQPIDPTEYKDNLRDFVERVMLRSYKIADLDSTSNARVEQALDTVVQARDDRRTLEPAFDKLAQQALASRLDTARTGTQSPAAQATVGTGAQQAPGAKQPAPPLNAPQAAAVVTTALRKTGIDLTKLVPELEAAAGGTVKVPKTNNTMANAVLQAMGILA